MTPWSLQRRLTLLFAASILGLLLLGVGFGSWQIRDTLSRELDALCEEEVAELAVLCHRGPLDPARFQELARVLDAEHAGARVSLRAWADGGRRAWSEGGAPPAIPFPALDAAPDDVTVTPAHGFRWRRTTIEARLDGTDDGPTSTLLVELLVDGAPREADLERVASGVLVLALLGCVLGIIGGALLAKRVATLLEEVATSAETARLDSDACLEAPAGAPVEVHRVAEAFQRSLSHMRSQHARNLLLTAGLAHELRSPLQNLTSTVEVALLRRRDGPEYEEMLTDQLRELRSLALVVDNLITLTALRDGTLLPRTERFDLGVEAELRLDPNRVEAERRGVELALLTRGDLSLVGDREALLLMLRNLVSNAVRWTASGTEVRVELDGTGEALRLVVTDHGPGVPEDERDAVFEAFHQGSTPSGLRAGYGLGLALAKAAIEAHGGSIEIDAAPSGGARFTVELARERPRSG